MAKIFKHFRIGKKPSPVNHVDYQYMGFGAFTAQPARCNSESNLAGLGGHNRSSHINSDAPLRRSQDDMQVTLCDDYQDPEDLIAELKTNHALSGSDGCLEEMYSTPYASMNMAASAKLAAAAAVAKNHRGGDGSAVVPPRPPHVRRANSASSAHPVQQRNNHKQARETCENQQPAIPAPSRKPKESANRAHMPHLPHIPHIPMSPIPPPQQFQGGGAATSPGGPPIPAPRVPKQGTMYQNVPPAPSGGREEQKTPPRTSSRQQFPLPNNEPIQLRKKDKPLQNPTCDNRPEEDYDSPWDLPKTSSSNATPHSQPSRPTKTSTSSIGSSVGSDPSTSPSVAPKVPAHRSASSASNASESATKIPKKPPPERPQELLPSNSSPDPTSSRPCLPLNLNGSPKRSRQNMAFNFGCTVPLAVGETVDPKVGLEKQGWYHGSISRLDAENLLRAQKEGSYLVRISESSKQDYSLSIKSARGFMHMKIVHKPEGRYVLGQFSKPFESIPEMIHHYSLNKLPIKGAEHMSLLHPVIAQLL